ncbi:noncompact myelin-associated protein [Megalops cyprinoides]|uniref:noncompact myelin-associated protein n=1 Tax=Megalops cyprinoides TaxID=118141 RepID=UPI001863B599|nr:noncompact myelin-associated protein [Megalops cyprinoides]
MQTTVGPTVTNFTTSLNTTTKSKEQVLIQSSGAMIAVIVIGIIIILAILLIILKTYNRRTHMSRVLGGGSKPRKKSSSTVQTNTAMGNVGASSVSGSFAYSRGGAENGFQLPRVEMSSLEQNNLEQYSTTSGSTVVTIHGAPSLENT